MKVNYKFLGFIVVAFSLSLFSCKSFVEDINDDPNNATDVPLEAVINSALTGMIIAHEGEDARLSCMWSGQFSGSDRQYSAYHVYNLNAEDFEWDKYYIAVENATVALAKAEASQNNLAIGICKIIKAHCLGTVAYLTLG